jgi:hypothetical protein
MAERILIEFKRDRRIVAVTDFRTDPDERGVILDGETSAFPRGFRLSVTPADPVTEERVRRVRQRLDWRSPRSFRLNMSRQGHRLQLEGVDPKALPAGRYNIEFRLSGIRFKKSISKNQRISEGGKLELTFEEKQPKRRFDLNTPLSEFDDETKNILQASQLDGKRADRWIQPNVRHRDQRKACLMNILAKLAVVPSRHERLNRFVRNVFFAEMDRIYAEVAPDFFEIVKQRFLDKDVKVHSTHKRLLSRIPGSPDDYKLESYREKRATGSLQVIGAVPKNGRDVAFVDIDIDKANPGFDLARFFIHFGHLFDSRKTNHLTLRKKIAAQTGDFLYYDAVKV